MALFPALLPSNPTFRLLLYTCAGAPAEYAFTRMTQIPGQRDSHAVSLSHQPCGKSLFPCLTFLLLSLSQSDWEKIISDVAAICSSLIACEVELPFSFLWLSVFLTSLPKYWVLDHFTVPLSSIPLGPNLLAASQTLWSDVHQNLSSLALLLNLKKI